MSDLIEPAAADEQRRSWSHPAWKNEPAKSALRQALLLGSFSDFDDCAAYESFVETVVQRMNARVEQRLAVERGLLRPLPARRTAEFDELPARVSKYGIFTIKGAQYSVPSRLIALYR